MDRIPSNQQQIQELTATAAAARACLAGEVLVIRRRLDVPARVRRSLFNHPAAWMLGSVGTGLLASRWLRRPKPSPENGKKSRGMKTLLGLTLTAARPLAKIWLSGQLKGWLATQAAAMASFRSGGRI